MLLFILTMGSVAIFCITKGYIGTAILCLISFLVPFLPQKKRFLISLISSIIASIILLTKGHFVIGVLPLLLIPWNIYGFSVESSSSKKKIKGLVGTTVEISYMPKENFIEITGVKMEITPELKIFTLSLIRWTILQKLFVFITGPFSNFFIPSYELAIFQKENNEIDYYNPCFVFHFADEDIANTRMDWIGNLLEEGGIENLINNLKGFDPKKESIFSDYVEYFERLMKRKT